MFFFSTVLQMSYKNVKRFLSHVSYSSRLLFKLISFHWLISNWFGIFSAFPQSISHTHFLTHSHLHTHTHTHSFCVMHEILVTTKQNTKINKKKTAKKFVEKKISCHQQISLTFLLQDWILSFLQFWAVVVEKTTWKTVIHCAMDKFKCNSLKNISVVIF